MNELVELYASAITASGSPLIDKVLLDRLVSFAEEKRAMIGAMETYRIDGELEIPCIEYGIYGFSSIKGFSEFSSVDKIKYMKDEMNFILDQLEADGEDYRFSVWFDSTD